jgi:iron uptake system component EfeO
LAACGSGSSSDDAASGGSGTSPSGQTVAVTITDAGCEPAKLELPAGPTTFAVENKGADAVTEFELLDGDHLLGEAENVASGLSGKFSLTLKPGSYTSYCPGGTTSERGTVTVTGKAAATSAAAAAAVARYRTYLERQTASLVARTRPFVAAVQAGDVARAKALYGPARVRYERIEPVAESFGDLDPDIDARAGDVPKASWTGFHPIEQSLWVKGTTAGDAALARKLQRDVERLERLVANVKLEPAQIANGAVELLGEVSKSKVTGEEERYSHIDLVDFEANVDGAEAAFVAVEPMVSAKNPKLAKTIETRFADVHAALAPYRKGSGFVSYTQLTDSDTRKLSRAIDALAEPLSKVGAIVVAQT